MGVKLTLSTAPFDKLRFNERVFDLCCHPWLYGLVNCKGNLTYCDHLLGANASILGHVRDKVEDIWNGEKAQRIRTDHVKKFTRDFPDHAKGVTQRAAMLTMSMNLMGNLVGGS